MPLPWEERYLDMIRRNEGYDRRPRWDVRQMTIGPGVRYTPGMDTSPEGIERKFRGEVAGARSGVRDLNPNMTPGQEWALTDLGYNAGRKWMGAGLGDAVRRGDWQDAYNRYNQYGVSDPSLAKGVANRRGRMAQELLRPASYFGSEEPSGPTAPMGAPSMPDIMTAQRPPLPEEWGPPMGLGAGAPPAQGPGAIASFLSNLFGGQGQAAPPPVAPPPQDMLPPPPQAPPISAMGQPDMAPGPAPPAPPPGVPSGIVGNPMQPPSVSFPPIGDLGGFGFRPPPDAAALSGGPMGPLMPGAPQPFPTDTNVPPSPGVSVPPVAPATDTGPASPVMPAAAERRGPQGGGMAPQMAGGGAFGSYLPQGAQDFFGKAYNAFANPLTGAGFQLLFPGSQAGGTLATAGMRAGHERRAEEELGMKRQEFGRTQAEHERRLASWEKLFPSGGEMNPNHPLAKGLAGLGPMVQALGPEAGLDFAGKYALADATEKRKLEYELQQMEMIERVARGGDPRGAQAPAVGPPPQAQGPAPSAAPFTAPPSGALPSFAPVSPTAAFAGGYEAPPPGVQAPPRQAAAPAAAAEPDVMGMPLSEARRRADVYRKFKRPDEFLEKQIALAEEPEREFAKKQAANRAEQLEKKPQVRAVTADTLAGMDELADLAKEIKQDPRLPGATNVLVDIPLPGAQAALFAKIDRLKNMTGFRQLQALKQMSPQGGALGQVSDRDLATLQNTIATLSRSQDLDSMKKQLGAVEDFVAKNRHRITASYKETYGEDWAPPGGEPEKRKDDEEKKAGPKYGPTLTVDINGKKRRAHRNLETGELEELR